MATKTALSVLLLFIISSCATYKPQYAHKQIKQETTNATLSHSFYLIGDAGNSPIGTSTKALKRFKKDLEQAPQNSTAIFLGDNIYEHGLPKKNHDNRAFAEHQLNVQIDALKNFKGNAIFIPGNHDWYNGLDGLKRQEKYVENNLGKNTFLPENGCPIKKVTISEDIVLLVIDTEWYLTNWNKHPTINDNCDIKTRQRFFDELNDQLKKVRGKTTILAMHHPLFTNGSHGGQFSLKSNLLPLPVVGTLKNIIRETSGLTTVDIQNKRYNEFRKRLITIAQINNKTIIVSGHEHNLQHIIQDNIHQIVSGSGSKLEAVRNVGGGQFSYAAQGYVRLDVFNDGSSKATYITVENENPIYQTTLFKADEKANFTTYPNNFPKEKTASIYTDEETNKSGFYKFLWGERYRKYYSTKVTVPTVNLDTLLGGLTPVRKGGGNQSKSLRLEAKDGSQYVMRALRKNAVQYLQAVLFKDQYVEDQFTNTKTEGLILDVFTGSHPYAPFVVGTLADGAGVYHTNPKLYYIPKQNVLGSYNDDFGDELYMIEEHTSEGHSNQVSFGYKNKLISTDDMMKKIHKDEDIVIDEASYIRARLFDMLIGDWDRHQDQWRWIEFKENGKKIYKPMPRDRDQAFSKMSDGALLGTAVKLLPTARLLRSYSNDLVDVKGVNVEPYPIDMELLQTSNFSVWEAQVKRIQEGVTDTIIEQAFLEMPKEIRDKTIEDIKNTLKARRSNLLKIAKRYYALLSKYAVIKGTNKDDWYDIERLANGQTKITAYRIKDGKKADVFLERIYNKDETKEIWIYALDDEDQFHVYGDYKNGIKVRLIGGQNNDIYNIENGSRLNIYDYKSKKNTFKTKKGRIKLTDNYQTNVYNYKKLKNNTAQIIPTLGANPDDGFKIGATSTFTTYGFERNPFSSQHTISGAYYFATSGFEANYKGEFANVFKQVNLGIEASFNSPNFAINYFGFGNSTPNFEADDNDGVDADLDFNRVKIGHFKLAPSLIFKGQLGSKVTIGFSFESNDIERTQGRFIETLASTNSVFEDQNFIGANASYNFINKDNEAFSTNGFQFNLEAGYKNNVDSGKGFGYFKPAIGFDYKLIHSGNLVLATNATAQLLFGDDFEFYQAASIGANTGLRGYRNQRFTGKQALVHSTDLRWNITRVKTSILPIHLGVFGGFDYGRVWVNNNLVTQNTFNTNTWNTSVGGGVFINMANMMTANISAFNSDDGLRLAFRLGFGF